MAHGYRNKRGKKTHHGGHCSWPTTEEREPYKEKDRLEWMWKTVTEMETKVWLRQVNVINDVMESGGVWGNVEYNKGEALGNASNSRQNIRPNILGA